MLHMLKLMFLVISDKGFCTSAGPYFVALTVVDSEADIERIVLVARHILEIEVSRNLARNGCAV